MNRWKKLFIAEVILLIVIFSMNKSVVIAFISIFVHELSHIIIAKNKGSRFNNVQVHLYGAKAEFDNIDELSSIDKIKIYIAGPLINLIIVILFTSINFYFPNEIYKEIMLTNLGLFLFNLLPAYPLDGARMLEIILAYKFSYRKTKNIISKISYSIGVFFLIIFIAIIIKKSLYNFSLLFCGIIIIYITRSEIKASMYILMGNIFMKRNKLLKNKYLENRCFSVYYKQELVNLMTIIDRNRFNTFYILDDDLKVLFIMNEDELIESLKIYGNMTLEEYYKRKCGKSN